MSETSDHQSIICFHCAHQQLPYWQERCFSHADLAAATSDAGRFLASACAHIRVSLPPDRRATCVWHREARAAFHIYALNSEAAAEETAGDDDQDSGGGDHTVASHQWMLPHVEFDGVWESLVLDAGVQDSLLDYAECALHFSDAGVDEKIVSWNRLVLLHGPPGTGKTSLCKALAQKLSIRLAHRYAAAVLLEINAHSLFSKWFSESGKLVLKLFEHIRSMLEQEDCLFCVLIDEVESLTAARQAALSGSEPSDAIRVVNALLTQLDRLKRHPNVLVLTTSNITDAIDTAFVDRCVFDMIFRLSCARKCSDCVQAFDLTACFAASRMRSCVRILARADIKQYIGWPSAAAVYDILRSCTVELARKRVVLTGAADGAIDLEHVRARHDGCGGIKFTALAF